MFIHQESVSTDTDWCYFTPNLARTVKGVGSRTGCSIRTPQHTLSMLVRIPLFHPVLTSLDYMDNTGHLLQRRYDPFVTNSLFVNCVQDSSWDSITNTQSSLWADVLSSLCSSVWAQSLCTTFQPLNDKDAQVYSWGVTKWSQMDIPPCAI